MRKFAVLAAVAVAISMFPAHAGSRNVMQKSFTFDGALPCSAACSYFIEPASTACTNPSPPGTFVDRVVKAPKRTNFMVFRAYPVSDWDIFVCQGKKLRGYSWNGFEQSEHIAIKVKPGRRYTLRAFNFSDADPLPARYVFAKLG